jgi:hypothetical protein
MTRADEDLLVEQVAGAHRPPSVEELQYHSAWHDLDAAARERAFDLARALRPLEAALDEDGLSTTARAVLRKVVSARTD